MAKLLKLRRGTTSQHSSFTGAEGEVTVDTDKESLVVHNGSQAGGFPLLRQDLSNLPAGTIDNADVASNAAIAGTKISPNFGSQGIDGGALTITGDVPTITLTDANNNPDYKLIVNGGTFLIHDSTNGTDKIKIQNNAEIDITPNVDFANGIDVTGETTTDKLTVEDDGSSGPLVLIKSDDNQPWALQIRNDTYSTGSTVGYKIYQNNNGNVDARVSGDGGYPQFAHSVDDGSTTKKIWETTTNSGFKAFYNTADRLETTNDGVTIDGNLTVTSDISANKLALTDDGSGSPTLSISTDDQSPWAFQIKNDTYWNSAYNGFKAYQDNSGNFYSTVQGNGAFINHFMQTVNGGTTNTAIKIDTNRAVLLYYQNNDKLKTLNTGVEINGVIETNNTPNADPYAGFHAKSSGSGNHCGFFADAATGANAQSHIRFGYSGSPKWQWRVPWHAEGTSAGMWLYDYSINDDILKFSQGGNADFKGNITPRTNGDYNLGSSSYRWANVYTNDLHLSNEGHTNNIDGTWGDWTIQEGESDLFLKNNRSGKKYKFNLTEVA